MVKKGFFFSLDAFFAILIFTLVLVSVYGYFINTQELKQQYFFSEDLFDIFINTRMNELGGTYPEINELYNSEVDEIRNNMDYTLTIMEQIITLKNINTEETDMAAESIIGNLTENLFDDRYGFSFDVNGLIYNEGQDPNSLVARQRFVSGFKPI